MPDQTKQALPRPILSKDMQLADVVRFPSFERTWNVSIVKQVTDTEVTIFRPYGTTADFSYIGGVICYIGIEEYNVSRDSNIEYILLERKELL